MIEERDDELFDDVTMLALAQSSASGAIGFLGDLKTRLMARLPEPEVPHGFSLRLASDDDWQPHAVRGIRMKVLSVDRQAGRATLLLDVAPGTRFPAHHHSGAEECYVLTGSVHTCGRRLESGDFVGAAAGTDHAELWTDEGCSVLLIVPADELSSHSAR